MTSAASMATRLPTAVILVSLLSLVAAIVVGVQTGSRLGGDLNEDRLSALRSAGASDVAVQVVGLERRTDALASSPQAVTSVDAFADAYAELANVATPEIEAQREDLVAAYQERYLEPLAAAGREVDLRDLVDDTPPATYLQYHYAIDLGSATTAARIDDARDGSPWSEVHRAVHPIYRDVVDRFDLADLYLIEPTDGLIVYSTQKRPDLGTSLDLGPFSGSFLARLFGDVRADPGAGTRISDVSFYDPALLTPVAAVASPIMDGDRLAGVLVLMYDATRFTEILTAGGDWDSAGFPQTGESFLFGADGLVRSDPRGFIEDRRAQVAHALATGAITEAQASSVQAAGTSILIQPVIDETIDAGLDRDREVRRRATLTGGEALSTVQRVELDGVEWFIATEVDSEAAASGIDDFVDILVVGTAVFLVVLAFLAVAWAARIVQPLRAISERLRSPDHALDPIEIPSRSPIEFRGLAESFGSMSLALDHQRTQLAEARQARPELLRRLLPLAVAERVTSGEREAIEEAPQTTVAVVVVTGLDAMARDGAGANSEQLVNELYGELDALAERHGLERVKIIGDAYVAACGHARPYIDHGPRAAAFAIDAREATRELCRRALDGLDVAIGIDSGSVTVGLAMGNRLLYDVWGDPVTAAHRLARRAHRGEILLSSSTRILLPDSVETARNAAGAQSEDWWLLAPSSTAGSS